MERFPASTKRSNLETEDHQIKPLGDLKIYKKLPLENYFEGTRESRRCKRKVRVHKTQYLNELLEPETHETLSTPLWWHPTKIKEQTNEETLKTKQAQLDFYRLQKKFEYEETEAFLRAKAAAEESIKEQENLTKTWMGFLKRKQNYLNRRVSDGRPKPFFKERPRKVDTGMPITSQRFWKEAEDQTSKNRKKETSELEKTFKKCSV